MTMNARQRKQFILLGVAAVFLVATVFLLLQVFRPNAAVLDLFGTSDAPTVQQLASFPLEFFRDPKFVLLRGEVRQPAAQQMEGLYINPALPLEPENLRARDMKVGSKVFLSWKAPAEYADVHFVVYRSETQGVQGEAITEMKEESFLDTGLENGTTYYYTVHTATDSGESSNTTQVSAAPTDTTPPAPPLDVTVASTAGEGVTITWALPQDEDVAYVNIYRSDAAGSLGFTLASRLTDGSYSDSSAEENVTYYYTLTAVDTSGNESEVELAPNVGRANPFLPI